MLLLKSTIQRCSGNSATLGIFQIFLKNCSSGVYFE